MAVKRSVEGLRENAQKKRKEAFKRVERGIQQLIKENHTINFNTVAETSGVSKAWLYKEKDVRNRIEHLREQSGSKKRLPAKQRASDASKVALIRTLKERIKRLESHNKDLRRQNEVASSHILKVRDLEKEVQRLQSDNERLRQRAQKAVEASSSSPTIQNALAELGVTWNSTLERLIDETPRGIVETAFESLREALKAVQVKNPGGFLNKAIRDAWRPNEAYQEKVGIEEFNEWWKWAYREGLVKAATQIDGVQHVLTVNDDWVPFRIASKEFSAHKERGC